MNAFSLEEWLFLGYVVGLCLTLCGYLCMMQLVAQEDDCLMEELPLSLWAFAILLSVVWPVGVIVLTQAWMDNAHLPDD